MFTGRMAVDCRVAAWICMRRDGPGEASLLQGAIR